MNKSTPIHRAVAICGGQTHLGRAIGASQSQVQHWYSGLKPVPPTRCRDIERATGGQVTRYELRPDVFGADRDE